METTFGPVGELHVEAYAAPCAWGWLGFGRVVRGEDTLARVTSPILPLAEQALGVASEKSQEVLLRLLARDRELAQVAC